MIKARVCGFGIATSRLCFRSWPAIFDETFGIVGIFGESLSNYYSYSFPKVLNYSFVSYFAGSEAVP